MKNSKPKVSVVTITYAHEKYIEDTLRGVLMQQYDGPIEFIIANDNSPDNTDEVVKKFFDTHPIPENIEIKYTCHQENKGMMPNFIWALEQATGEYIALCEGDDYWTDPLKLQKQVDFLEENEDVVACGTYIDVMKESLEKSASLMQLQKFSTIDLLKGYWIPTLTNVFRKTALQNSVSDIVDDVTLLANISSKGGYMVKLPFVSAVYRYHGAGAVSGQTLYNNWKRNFNSVYIFASKYKSQKFIKQAMKNCFALFGAEMRKNVKADYKIFALTISTYLRFRKLLRR